MDIDGFSTSITSDQKLDTDAEVEFKTITAEAMEIQTDAVIPTPDTGYASLYFKADNLLYSKDAFGVERLITREALNQDTWRFSTALVGDPTTGYFRIDSASFSAMSEIAIHIEDSDSDNLRPLLQSLSDGDQIYLSNTDSTNTKLINIIDVTDNTTYFSYTASLASENNTAPFNVTEIVKITFLPKGASFDQELNTTSNVQFNALALPTVPDVAGSLTSIESKTQNINLGTTTTDLTVFNGEIRVGNNGRDVDASLDLITNAIGGITRVEIPDPLNPLLTTNKTILFDPDVEVSNEFSVKGLNVKNAIEGSVTIHSDVTDSGSGQIITAAERTAIGTNTSDIAGKLSLDGSTPMIGTLTTKSIQNPATIGQTYDIGTTLGPYDDIYSRGTITAQAVFATGGISAGGLNLKSAIEGPATIHSDITSTGSGAIITAAERTAIGVNTSNNVGSVTIHSDITDAGSGAIITTAERTAISTNTTNNTGSVTIHSDVTDAGSGQIITSAERNLIGTTASGKLSLDGTLPMAGNLNMNGNQINNLTVLTDTGGQPHAFVRTDLRSDVSSGGTYAGINCGKPNTGSNNSGFGENALSGLLTLGNGNSAFGRRAGEKISNGCCNSTFGDSTLINATTGSFNTVVGFNSGNGVITGSRNVMLGQEANVDDENALARIALGYASICDEDRHCVIGGPLFNNSVVCIKPGFADDCDLGATNRKFKDAYLNGSLKLGEEVFAKSGPEIGNNLVLGSAFGGTTLNQFDPASATDPSVTVSTQINPNDTITCLGGGYQYLLSSNLLSGADDWEIEFVLETINEGPTIGITDGTQLAPASGFLPPGGLIVRDTWITTAQISLSRFTSVFSDTATNYTTGVVLTQGMSVWIKKVGSTMNFYQGFVGGVSLGVVTNMNTAKDYYIIAGDAVGTVDPVGNDAIVRINTSNPVASGLPAVRPDMNNTTDLGAPTNRFKDLWLSGFINGLTPIGGLFAGTADVGGLVTGEGVPLALTPTGVGGLSVPANGFAVGDSFHLKLGGLISSKNGHSIEVRIFANAALLATTTPIVLTGLTDAVYEIELDFTVRAIGGAGVALVNSSGQMTYSDVGQYRGFSIHGTSQNTFSTLVANTLSVTGTFTGGATGTDDSILVSHFVLSKTY